MSLPDGWATGVLGDIAEFVRGIAFPSSDKKMEPGAGLVACLRTANVQDEIDWTDLWYIPERHVKSIMRRLRVGDVLMSTANSQNLVGKVALVRAIPVDATLGAFISVIRARPDVSRAFLFYKLRSSEVQEALRAAASQTTNIANISAANVLELPVALPPVNEQRRIVAKLDAIFEQTRFAKDRLERVPALLDKLKRSILAAACAGRLTNHRDAATVPSTWRWSTLQDLVVPGGIFDGARDHGSGTSVAQNLRTADYTDSGVRVIRLENLAHLAFVEEKRTFISEEKFKGLMQNEIREGDLLFGSFIDEQVRVCRLPGLGVPAIAKADCFCVRPDVEKVLPEYLLLQLACQRTRDSIESQAHGLGRLRITTKQLRAIQVPLCSKSEQQEIVDKVRSQFAVADRMLRKVLAGLKRIDEVERAALAKAFRGELVAQDPADEPASLLLERLCEPSIQQAERGATAAAKRGPRRSAKGNVKSTGRTTEAIEG